MHRRIFVKSGALALVTMGLSPQFLRRTAFAAELRGAAKGRILICLFQRGAADGLSMVAPFGDKSYYELRKDARSRQIMESWFRDRFAAGTPTKNVNTMAPFLTLAAGTVACPT